MARAELHTLREILRIQRRVGIHPSYYLPPLLLSMGAAFFEGISIGLLVPMMQGFLTHDFSFIKDITGLHMLLQYLPEKVLSSDQLLFGVLLGIFVVSTVLKNILRFLSSYAMAYVAMRSIHHLRKLMFTRYLTFGKLYFDRSNIGHDATLLMEFAKNALRPLASSDKYVNGFFSLVGYLTIMTFISWQLTLSAIPLFFVLHFSVQRIIRSIRSLSRKIAQNASELNKKTVEILSAAPLVQSFNMQEEERKRYTILSELSTRLAIRVQVIQQLIPPMQELITLLAVLVLFSGMLFLLVRGHTGTASSFLVYFYLVLNSSSKFGILTNARGVLADATGPVEEVVQILNDEDKHYVPEGKDEFEGMKQGIEFRNVEFSYDEKIPVLDGLSFTMKKGQMTAIVGATGAGKTTVINLLLRHYDCPPGSILIDGKDLREFTFKSLRSCIALVSQETFLLHDTLRSNIAYGLNNVSDDDVRSAVRRARLEEYVAKLPNGLETLIGDRGVQLSGGEKQRVSIARALLKKAGILILDEATSALDSHTERLIQEAIDDAVQGKTSIVIAHRLSTIQHADVIAVIEKGKLAEQGTLQELLDRKGRFYGFWEQQKFV